MENQYHLPEIEGRTRKAIHGKQRYYVGIVPSPLQAFIDSKDLLFLC